MKEKVQHALNVWHLIDHLKKLRWIGKRRMDVFIAISNGKCTSAEGKCSQPCEWAENDDLALATQTWLGNPTSQGRTPRWAGRVIRSCASCLRHSSTHTAGRPSARHCITRDERSSCQSCRFGRCPAADECMQHVCSFCRMTPVHWKMCMKKMYSVQKMH